MYRAGNYSCHRPTTFLSHGLIIVTDSFSSRPFAVTRKTCSVLIPTIALLEHDAPGFLNGHGTKLVRAAVWLSDDYQDVRILGW